MPKEAAKLAKLDWKSATKEEIGRELEASAAAMEAVFRKMAASAKGGKWTPAMYFSYCIAHEAHHRAQIELSWRLNGRDPDDAFLYSLWEWPKFLKAGG